MRRWQPCLATLLCACLLALGDTTALAQEAVTPGAPQARIRQLRMQVMPEFDNPRVLVVVQGRLDLPDGFPATATFRLPTGAQINQMAIMSMDGGGTISKSYDAQPDAADPRWLAVTYTLDNAHFFYEYYYDPLQEDADKEFTFLFNSLYPVEDLLLEVQQPARSSNFRLDPPAAASRPDSSLGLTYHQVKVGAVAAGDDVAVTVRYTKPDAAPSLSWQQVMSLQDKEALPLVSSPATTSLVEREALPGGILAFGAAAALALLVLSIAYAVWRQRTPSSSVVDGGAATCRECGTTLRAGSIFCHACGSAAPGREPRHPAATQHRPQRSNNHESPAQSQLEVRP